MWIHLITLKTIVISIWVLAYVILTFVSIRDMIEYTSDNWNAWTVFWVILTVAMFVILTIVVLIPK